MVKEPIRLEAILDGAELRRALTSAARESGGDDARARARALALLGEALQTGRDAARDFLEAGGGVATARFLSDLMDEILGALFDFTTVHIIRSRNPTEGERLSILAVGGYGRGVLGPHSDVDLLFLRAYKPTPWAESVTEFMLYVLWDLGLKVGHAARSLEECVRIARDDHTVATALLEARRICGDPDLAATLALRFRKDVAQGREREFIAAKLAERDDRHERAGASRYLVEPNLKNGKGGLRDLHTLFWLLRFLYGVRTEADLIALNRFTRSEIRAFRRAFEFFWTLRCHLHFLAGRAEERVTFDLQPELARRMGFRDRAGRPGVERLMKRYFLVAREVGALTRILCAKLEADQQKPAPSPLSFLFETLRWRKTPAPGFVMAEGRLSVQRADLFSDEPVEILRLFALSDQMGVDIHPDALSAVTRNLRRIGPNLRLDAEARDLFLQILVDPMRPGATLRLLSESGVLGRFVPEFGRIVGQTQFNMYHHYTVDEHTLRAVEAIHDIERGRYRKEHPVSTRIFPKILNRRALYLAMLLHDVGKGLGDQSREGAIAAREACFRLGLAAEETELVAWLVEHHLLMSDVAQKRDLSDPRTIASFAQVVEAPERLRLLLVLTVADIRAVGQGVWNGWKGELLRDLYFATEAAFLGGRTDEAGVKSALFQKTNAIRTELFARHGEDAEILAFLNRLDGSYWATFDAEAAEWHLDMARAAGALCEECFCVAARQQPAKGVTEILVMAPDRPGLFADLTAVIAEAGANVADARIHTSPSGQAVDVLAVQGIEGGLFADHDPKRLERLLNRLRAAARGELADVSRTDSAKVPSRRQAAFAIKPWVLIDNEASAVSTVAEVSGRDRPGLLAALARAFSEHGVSIVSAHIGSHGERASDAFYVQEVGGGKVIDAARIARLKAALTLALSEDPDGFAAFQGGKIAAAEASDGR